VDGYDKDQWQEVASEMKAVKPNIPASPLLEPGAIFYDIDLDDDPVTPVYSYEREIYTFEARADATNKTCLVIGGYYNGNLTYYRVDFAGKDGTRLSLLRNHNYRVVIKEVLDAGYPSEGEAVSNSPSNIVVEITENDGTLGLIAFDEQNYLGASTGEITIRRWDDAGHRFSVSTDVADGWEVVGTSETGEFHEGFELTWLTVTSSGLTVGKGDVTFSVTENDTDARRVGYIHLVAGRLHLTVKVVQRFVEIWITGASELFFEPSLGVFTGQTFRVHWLPKGARVSAASIPHSGYPAFAYDPVNDVPGVGALASFGDPSGERDVTFCPTALTAAEINANPYVVKSSFARFVAFYNDDFGSTDIEARQSNYRTILSNVKSYYVLGGGTHSFTVRGNTAWKIDHVENDIGIQGVSLSSGGYNTTGQAVNFQIPVNNANDGKIAKIILVDPTGRVANVEVPIKGVSCGLNGTGLTKDIGGSRNYITHAYGTGAAQRCWMVENSREGTASAKTYANSAATTYANSGYYYTQTQAIASACPAGWLLFTDAEASTLLTAANQDKSGVGKWWFGSNRTGCHYSAAHSLGPLWDHWNQYGYWRGRGLYEIGNSSSSSNNLVTTQYSNRQAHWFSARCVQQ
jgi:uncharacterized protein (TIGR02145 family)